MKHVPISFTLNCTEDLQNLFCLCKTLIKQLSYITLFKDIIDLTFFLEFTDDRKHFRRPPKNLFTGILSTTDQESPAFSIIFLYSTISS